MTRISQFRGTCQICFHVQKLPSQVLSLHGYEHPQGWGFIGICPGANLLPFEQSCEATTAFLSNQLIPRLSSLEQKLSLLQSGGPDTLPYDGKVYDPRLGVMVDSKTVIQVPKGAPVQNPYQKTHIPSYADLLSIATLNTERRIYYLKQDIETFRKAVDTWSLKPLIPFSPDAERAEKVAKALAREAERTARRLAQNTKSILSDLKFEAGSFRRTQVAHAADPYILARMTQYHEQRIAEIHARAAKWGVVLPRQV